MTDNHDEIYEGRVARDEKNYPTMTHDELLARIDKEIKDNNFAIGCHKGAPEWILQSLRAVVELHQPREYKVAGTFTDGLIQTGCVCSGWSYPCPTIQAIEKELG